MSHPIDMINQSISIKGRGFWSHVFQLCSWEPSMNDWMKYKHLNGWLHTATTACQKILRHCLWSELITKLNGLKIFSVSHVCCHMHGTDAVCASQTSLYPNYIQQTSESVAPPGLRW
jgi:hypothetical protein